MESDAVRKNRRESAKALSRYGLQQLIEGLAEPVLVAQMDRAHWPVVLTNPAFDRIAGKELSLGRPFADVVQEILGRKLALDISESARQGRETSLAVEVGNNEYLLVMKPLVFDTRDNVRLYAAYWRAGAGGQADVHQELLKAKRRIKDLSREDQVTGLLSADAFREVLTHDWAVAAREKLSLALVAFEIDEFEQYQRVFGRHATESCQRRVAQVIRRCLRRASDVAGRIVEGEEDKIVVLSHASGDAGVDEFAARIADTVRELGLHHPHARESRFVTVSYRIALMQAGADETTAEEFLMSAFAPQQTEGH